MKTTLFPLLFISLLSFLMGVEPTPGAAEKNIPSSDATEQKLTLTVKGKDITTHTISQDSPVTFCFTNEGTKPIYLLDHFVVNGKPYLMEIEIHDAKGEKILDYMCRVKVEWANKQKYILLRPSESYGVSFPFSEVIKDKFPAKLPTGDYTVTARYKNHLGYYCFKGTLVSKPTPFRVEDSADRTTAEAPPYSRDMSCK